MPTSRPEYNPDQRAPPAVKDRGGSTTDNGDPSVLLDDLKDKTNIQTKDDFVELSDRSRQYNCHAYCVGIQTSWAEINCQADLDLLYTAHGYAKCDSSTLHKAAIAVYYKDGTLGTDGTKKPIHSHKIESQKYRDGLHCVSKLGKDECIRHKPNVLEKPDGQYGKIEAYWYLVQGKMPVAIPAVSIRSIKAAAAKIDKTNPKLAKFVNTYNWYIGDARKKEGGGAPHSIALPAMPSGVGLVAFGIQILPLLLVEMAKEENELAVHIYNKLQTNPALKVPPGIDTILRQRHVARVLGLNEEHYKAELAKASAAKPSSSVLPGKSASKSPSRSPSPRGGVAGKGKGKVIDSTKNTAKSGTTTTSKKK